MSKIAAACRAPAAVAPHSIDHSHCQEGWWFSRTAMSRRRLANGGIEYHERFDGHLGRSGVAREDVDIPAELAALVGDQLA